MNLDDFRKEHLEEKLTLIQEIILLSSAKQNTQVTDILE
jgi:hypothetical protein